MKLRKQIQETMNSPSKLYNIDGTELKDTKLVYKKIENYLLHNYLD
jgi:hypothetical protein